MPPKNQTAMAAATAAIATILAPPSCKGMKVLDRASFSRTIDHLALRIPKRDCTTLMNDMKPLLFNQPRLSNLKSDVASKETKLLLLSPEVSKDLQNVPDIYKQIIEKRKLEVLTHRTEMGYDHWNAVEILKAILPTSEAPTGFDHVGHIAHLNLEGDFLEYKSIIGQVILDKNKHITTVVNKTGEINTKFRFFDMEILAGVDNMIAEARESYCTFKFDFSKVYWNSKLHTEHDRLVKLFKKNDTICDVFAGVGPFAIPAAKKGCVVYANDLNPVSHEYLVQNIATNKVTKGVRPYNLDGREFIKKAILDLHEAVLKELDAARIAAETKVTAASLKPSEENFTAEKKEGSEKASEKATLGKRKRKSKDVVEPPRDVIYRGFDHFVMNLPGTAIEFLDAFRGSYAPLNDHITSKGVTTLEMPMVHCHCFAKVDDDENIMKQDVIQRVNEVMGSKLDETSCEVINVRSVAPNKDMMCISFRLPRHIAFLAVTEPR